MSKKITFSKIVMFGLLSTTLAITNLEIATSKSATAINVEIGQSADAATCNSRCAKKLSRLGVKLGRTSWRKTTNREEEHRQ